MQKALWTVLIFAFPVFPVLRGEPLVSGLSPEVLVVEVGSLDGRAILRGSGLEKLVEVRSQRDGKTTDFIVGRPLALPDGSRELRILVRPDAPLGVYRLVAVGTDWNLPIPGSVEVVALGDARAQVTSQGQDLNEAARRTTTKTLVTDGNQVPQVTGTHPDPLMISPDGRARTIRLAGKNLEKVTDVRLRKEAEEPRYRQNQGKLPFSHFEGYLDVRVLSGANTPIGTKYALDLMVEKFRAATVILEVGNPPPEAAPSLPLAPTAPPAPPPPPPGPRVIELPGPKPLPRYAP